jgi:nucleoside phosphorylase
MLSMPAPGIWSTNWVTAHDDEVRQSLPAVLRAHRRDLRAAVRRQWRAEELRRRLADPAPIPVRWRAAPASLAVQDHSVNVHGGGGPVAALGTVEELAGLLQRLPSARLVILGDPGAGKTTAVIRLVLDLVTEPADLDDRRPVPVLLSIGSWQPDRYDLHRWLHDALCADYPALSGSAPDGRTIAAALLDEGWILPVLDGLDEMPARSRPVAVDAVNAALHQGDPLVLTCRTAEYQAVVSQSDVVTAAAVIQLLPLTPEVLAAYLPRTARPRSDSTTKWDSLLAVLRDGSGGEAAQRVLAVLRSPLMIGLARETYSDTLADPAELLAPERFPTSAAIRAHLLDRAVAAAYRRPGRSYPPERAGAWLSELAGRMDRAGTYDLAWWRLFQLRSERVGAAVGAVVGGTAVGMLSAGAIRDARLFAVAVLLGAGIGAFAGHRQPAVPSAARWTGSGGFRRAWRSILAGWPVRPGAAGWLVALTTVVSLVGIRAGWAAAAVAATAVGLTRSLDAWLDVPLDIARVSTPAMLLRSDRITGLSRATLRMVILGGTAGVLAGPAAGAGVGGAAFVASAGFTAWFRFTLARLGQAAVGRLPWRLPAFLADAASRGLLRQAGGVYQFRHARLQDRLAGRPLPTDDLDATPEPYELEYPARPIETTLVSPRVAVVLTALEVEYNAVRAHLTDPTPVLHRTGTLFELGTLPGCRRRVALAVLGEGNQTAAVVAERAATLFRPDLVLFAGVAGALHDDLALGDIVVGTRVYAYHSGQDTPDGFQARPRSWDTPHRLEQRARYASRAGRWRQLLADPSAPPSVHFRPIAAGEVVVTTAHSSHASILRTYYGDAAAIEMEGAGLARAAHLHDALPALVVRGISDYADDRKHSMDRAGWQRIAAANAAAFALGLVADLPLDEMKVP